MNSKTAGGVGIAVGAILTALGFAVGPDLHIRIEHGRTTHVAPPAEFLYLDAQRVLAYLGEAERGLSSSQKETLTTTRKADASVGTGTAIAIGGGIEQQSSTEQVVTRKAADNFFVLDDALSAQQASHYRTRYPTSPRFCGFGGWPCRKVHEGDFVKLVGVRLRVPTYAVLLPKLNYAGRLPFGRQPPIPIVHLPRVLNRHAAQIKRYAAAVGARARVPVIVKAYRFPTATSVGKTFTFFLPVDYSLLVDSPALLSGSVTVVGKVIRRVDPVRQRRTKKAKPKTATFREPRYFDAQTSLTFVHAVGQLPNSIRRVIGIPRGKERRFVNASATVSSPGMVVIPIAIYQ
jgi:hypothetical protein